MRVSVVGLGSMGSALASCLLKAGHDVTVWNRTPEKAAPFAEAGATVVGALSAAVAASPLVIVCIKSHRETCALLKPLGAALDGKTVCDLSTGDTGDAEQLVAMLQAHHAETMLGMINAYPSGVGARDTAILTVCSDAAWDRHGATLQTLGGAATHVGTEPSALAALFAGLFTVRQSFMFGMVYGARVCRAAGVPIQAFTELVPGASLKLIDDYYTLFARTVPREEFDNPEASLLVYKRAMDDALNTYEAVNAPAELVKLMHDKLCAAVDAGLGDKQLTVLANGTA